ncbi:hypothetical protein AB0M81_25610, partial [Nocardia fluminea]
PGRRTAVPVALDSEAPLATPARRAAAPREAEPARVPRRRGEAPPHPQPNVRYRDRADSTRTERRRPDNV